MTTLQKGILVVIGVFAAIALYGAYLYPKAPVQLAGSPAGSTFNTAKFAGVVMSLATAGANGTSSSILNTDAGNRYVTGVRVGCAGLGNPLTAYTGAGLVSWQLTVGTSSTANPATLSPTNPLLSAAVVPTTTPNMSFSSSTALATPLGNAALWRSGEYESFSWNATTTGNCTVGVDYIGS